MQVTEIRKIIKKQQPFLSFGFNLNIESEGKTILGDNFLKFSSNDLKKRNVSIRISEIFTDKEKSHFYFLFVHISKTTPAEFNEDVSFSLESWLKEKQYPLQPNTFRIYPDKEDLESQFILFFNFLKEVFQIEELNKILRGDYWEFKTVNWDMFGR